MDQLEQTNQGQQKQADLAVRNNYYKNTMMYGFGLAGNVAGILLAVHRKSGFWGGLGWFLVGGLAGSATGFVIGSVLDGKPKSE